MDPTGAFDLRGKFLARRVNLCQTFPDHSPDNNQNHGDDDNGGGGECDDVDVVMRMTMMLMIMLVSTSAKLFPITHLSLLTHLEQKKSQKSYDWAPFTKLISVLGTASIQNNLMI